MVIFRRSDGKPGYHQAEGVDEAIRFVEMLRNQEKVTDARIFRMEEVPIEIRTYYKVEVVAEGDAPATTAAAIPRVAPPVVPPMAPPAAAPIAPVPPAVANALAETPASDMPLDPMPVEVAAGKARRFGRN